MSTQGGPRLVLIFLIGVVVVGAILVAAVAGGPVLSGAAIASVGAMVALNPRSVADAFRRLAWPPMPWQAWLVFGIGVVVAGVARTLSG